jgi:hypothetical protein
MFFKGLRGKMGEAVAALIVRGEQAKVDMLIDSIRRDRGLRLVLCKVGGPADFFLIKRLKEEGGKVVGMG